MADIYVDIDTGNDTTGDGSSGNPYQTLDKGITEATTNDTVILAPSSTDYAWVTDTIPAGLTIKCNTAINMLTQTWARIDGGGGQPVWTLQGNFTAENIYFYDTVAPSSSTTFKTDSNLGIGVTYQFTNCVLDQMESMISTATRGGVIGGFGTPTLSSLTCYFDRCLIRNIQWSSGGNKGGLVFSGAPSTDVQFRECTFHNDSGTKELAAYCVYSVLYQPLYRNCILKNDHPTNVICFLSSGGSTNAGGTITNCLYTNMSTTSATVTDSISGSDPLFLDEANNDYRLKPTSPAIDAGTLV